ncbi:LytR/AlgR family response regulator transcription factor [Aurantibacillus circumpalustris]|uniref:LytR/AlgR family response regulator transcription factor n=1 Tax=Aurantibacillus circumpalustris TaxID=3036359 RepID=UPI00295AE6F1|nr:LytTR family DNA-binding domain-containing protein [Aurantibacillus circumpalustris]
MITTLVIEDEKKSLTAICVLINKYCSDLNILGVATNADEGYKQIVKLKPQLVFLDIHMPGHSGFAMLRRFKEINFEVIFVTAFDKYAIQAFEFCAVDYILKPVLADRLIEAVSHAVERINFKTGSNLIIHFVHCLADKEDLITKFSVHHNGNVIFIETTDICSIESDGEAIVLKLNDGAHYYSSKRLHEFEKTLEETHNFIRINKSVLINTKHLKSYSKGEICVIELNNNQTFEVSRRRKNEILKKLREL